MSKAIAILGCSYKLPSTQADANFEQDLLEGKDLISVVAQDRWSFEQFHHPQKNHPGASYTFAAGSIGDVSQFDAGFLGSRPEKLRR